MNIYFDDSDYTDEELELLKEYDVDFKTIDKMTRKNNGKNTKHKNDEEGEKHEE